MKLSTALNATAKRHKRITGKQWTYIERPSDAAKVRGGIRLFTSYKKL